MSNSQDTADQAEQNDEDFEDIVEAVMETARGRWFLEEFSRRNRTADTAELLTAISRLEKAIPAEISATPNSAGPNVNAIRSAIGEMAEEISATKREIASIGQEGKDGTDIAGATAELDAVMDATENATSDILEAAEAVQEMAWTLREENVADTYCDALDLRATEIYTACSFQDITGQRTQKVVRLLQNLDQRISILAKLWADPEESDPVPAEARSGKQDEHLLNGPALGDHGVSQNDVDQMMDNAAWEDDHKSENLEVATAPPAETGTENSAPDDTIAEAVTPQGSTSGEAMVSGENEPDSVSETTDVSFEDLSQKDMDALFA